MSRKAAQRQRRSSRSRTFCLEALEDRCVPTGSVSGLVFQDYNANGVQDTREPGIGGIVVNAYDASNNLLVTSITSNTAATLGQYSLAIPGVTTAVQVEFVIPPSLSYLQPGAVAPAGAVGTLAGPSVQFVNNTASNPTGINYSVNNPANYTQAPANLNLAATEYVTGNQTNVDGNGTPSSSPAIVSIPYTARGDTTTPTTLATAGQVGSVYGLAYQDSSNVLYASALMKRNVGFGPSGREPFTPSTCRTVPWYGNNSFPTLIFP
jgi:SdrD B-like domain